MCANFVVGETTHSFLPKILVFRRVLDDQRASSIFWSQLFAVWSSTYHSSTCHKQHNLLVISRVYVKSSPQTVTLSWQLSYINNMYINPVN